MTQKPKAHHRASPLLIHEPPLQVLPSLAVAVGLNEAIVLQQIHYWLGMSKNVHDDRLWVYNTYEQWAEQFPFWSPEFIRKIVKSLRDKNLIEARQLSPNAWDKTNSYTINYEVLREVCAPISDAVKSTASMRKITPHRCGEKEVVHAVKSTASKRANPPHLNTETTSETTQRDTPKPPATPGAERDSCASFAAFWKHYPKKVGKDAAEKAFARKVKPQDVEAVMDALDKQRSSEQWTQDGGRFIPNPATWLNQGRWKDEGVDADEPSGRSNIFAGVL